MKTCDNRDPSFYTTMLIILLEAFTDQIYVVRGPEICHNWTGIMSSANQYFVPGTIVLMVQIFCLEIMPVELEFVWGKLDAHG